MIQIFKEIVFLVAHCAIYVNVLNVTFFEYFFQESGFARGPGSIDKKVHSGFEESAQSVFIGDHGGLIIEINDKFWV